MLQHIVEDLSAAHIHRKTQHVIRKNLKPYLCADAGKIGPPKIDKKKIAKDNLCASNRQIFKSFNFYNKNICNKHSKIICNECY